MKKRIAIIRGKFLNKYELQFYEPLVNRYDLLGIGSKTCFHSRFVFPTVKLFSPVDCPDFPYKMSLLNRLFTDANYLFGLEKVIAGFDIAHSAETYYRYTNQALKAKNKGLVKKVVVSVYENIPFAGEGIRGRREYKRKAFREVDCFIAVSQKTKSALLKEGCPEEKIVIINQHVDTDRFKPFKRATPGKSLTILFTGRLEFYKGVFDFVKAAGLVLNAFEKERISFNFVMVGQGRERKKLLALEKDLGIEKFFRHQVLPYSKMPAVYQKADIYVAPSRTTKHWQEQFSTVLLEAKASGLPIISTNTGGIPENVGKAGILVDEGDYQTIAQNIIDLIKNPKARIKMGKLAREDALKRFTLKQGASKLTAVYEKVLMT